MPVGNSDRGVGLWAGQVMFGLDNSLEYIDWWHDVLPNSEETYDHEGLMLSSIFTPSLTIGVSNYVKRTRKKRPGRHKKKYSKRIPRRKKYRGQGR